MASRSTGEAFARLLAGLESRGELTELAARLMSAGTWEAVADLVLDRCRAVGGDAMEDAVYDAAWHIAYGN